MEESVIKWLIEELTKTERNLINKTYLKIDNSIAGIELSKIFEQAEMIEYTQKRKIIEDFLIKAKRANIIDSEVFDSLYKMFQFACL